MNQRFKTTNMKRYILIFILLLGTANLKAQTLYVTSGGSVVTQNTPVNIAGNAIVASGSTSLVGATVSISSNFVAGQDVLGLNGAAIGGITSLYNAATGVLTLSGAESFDNYQATLRKVTYTNSSATPTTSARVITFSLNSAIPFIGSGHFYEYVTSSNISWSSANTAASARTYFGLQGYLATVTSAEENTFVSAKLGGNGCWMGGSDETVEGTWKWKTGPESGNTLTYFNWGASQPDNYNGVEDYLQFFAAGTWNDLPNVASVVAIAGYVVEYGGMAGDPVIHISDFVTVDFAPKVSNLTTATGTGIKWYDAASGGNLLTATTALVDGNHYYASQTVNSVESTSRLDVTATLNPATPATATHSSTETSITWNWNISATATGYKWSTTNNYASATNLGNTLTVTRTGLVCVTSYTIYVWAYNGTCNSAPALLTQITSGCIN
jgi:hypothetical protein